MPEVTVLTCVRNGMRFLPAAIESIKAQTFRDWEYIIVDDASVDNTPSYVAREADKEPRIRLIQRAVSGGPYIAANDGLQYSTGKYIVRMDSDDISFPGRLERQIAYMRTNRHWRACAAFTQLVDSQGTPLKKVTRSTLESGSLKWELVLHCSLVHSTACIEREMLEEVYTTSPLVDHYRDVGARGELVPDVEDYRMWCRLSRRNCLGVVPEILVHWRRHNDSIGARKQEQQMQLSMSVLSEHLHEILELEPNESLLSALIQVGLLHQYPIGRGLETLAQWDGWWQSDPSLDSTSRNALRELSTEYRRRFIRVNTKRQFFASMRYWPRYVSASPRPGNT